MKLADSLTQIDKMLLFFIFVKPITNTYQNFAPFQNGNSPITNTISKWEFQIGINFSEYEFPLLLNRSCQKGREI